MKRYRILKQATGALPLILCLLPLTAAGQEPTAEYIDQLTARAMERFQVPGIAVGVVKDGELVYAAGHGVRDIRYSDPIGVDSIFQIGSLTKAFTTAALGLLVDEGEIRWDDRVIDYLPEFRMHDPWVTREFTIRDLLTHRSGLGLGAGDLLFWPNQSSTRDDVIKAMRHLKPETSFRTAYAYDNLLYVIAGEVVAAVAGMSWEDFVETRIMAPLGMNDCRSVPERVVGNENRAIPHMVVDGELETTFFSDGSAMAPAGAANCNITGLAKWAAMHLAGGALPDGTRFFSEETHQELWNPVTLMPLDDIARQHSRTHFNAYALGWRLEDFFGYLRVGHSGGLQGMTTYIGLLPEKDIAVIVLTNQWSRAYRAIASGILNSYISDAPEDWVEIYGQSAAATSDDAKREVEQAFANRDADSKPSLPFAAYVGTYRDPWYGNVFVEGDNKGLIMRFGRTNMLVGPLKHFQHDTFVARWRDRSLFADAYATFSLGADGSVESIKMKAVSPDTDFSFDFHDLDLRRVAE